jgi:hypothetical protein
MVLYSFKNITSVPNGNELVDIALSKTQRKTPTMVHKGYAIGRIRLFYMRKVKFAQQALHDRLALILSEFPVLDVSQNEKKNFFFSAPCHHHHHQTHTHFFFFFFFFFFSFYFSQ